MIFASIWPVVLEKNRWREISGEICDVQKLFVRRETHSEGNVGGIVH